MPRARRAADPSVTVNRLDRTLAAIRDQLREVANAEGRIRELAESAVRIARGTGDVTQAAARAVLIADLSGRVENALRLSGPSTAARLARSLAAPSSRVSEVLRTFKRAGRVSNIGTATEPLWCWRPGDDIETADLMREVDLILRARPMMLRELQEALGMEERNRISGVLVRLQKDGVPVVNLGDGRRAVWAVQE